MPASNPLVIFLYKHLNKETDSKIKKKKNNFSEIIPKVRYGVRNIKTFSSISHCLGTYRKLSNVCKMMSKP